MSQYNASPGPYTVGPQKDVIIAYVLWFLLGTIGVHKFYLKQNGMGITYLLLGLVGYATVAFLIGFLFLIPLFVMMFIDLFTMPARVHQINSGRSF